MAEFRQGFVAGAAISIRQTVTFNASGQIVPTSANSDNAIGVAEDDIKAGERGSVVMFGHVEAKVVLGGAAIAGTELMPSAVGGQEGKLIAFAAGSGARAVARLIESTTGAIDAAAHVLFYDASHT